MHDLMWAVGTVLFIMSPVIWLLILIIRRMIV